MADFYGFPKDHVSSSTEDVIDLFLDEQKIIRKLQEFSSEIGSNIQTDSGSFFNFHQQTYM